jgi:AcrR family transcriptional regulator
MVSRRDRITMQVPRVNTVLRIDMARAVKGSRPVRTRRAEKVEATRRRIVSAATTLFGELGYAATTIEAVAA